MASNEWYQNGNKCEAAFKDGKLEGRTTWYENGNLKAEEFYKTGKVKESLPNSKDNEGEIHSITTHQREHYGLHTTGGIILSRN